MTSPPARPRVDCERHHAALSVPDVRTAAAFYIDRLGFEPAFIWGEEATFAGVNFGRVQLFLSRGTPCPEGCSVFFVVDDADDLFGFHGAAGVDIVQPIEDRPWGVRDYTIRDQDGYRLTFGHYIPVAGPAIEIERVDVPVRLERRLAGLLHDLAEHKRMSLSSCLEEILLHTCEPVDGGVASPHNARTLRYIQELKQKHGIDYDSHGSYRFVEAGE